MSRDRIDIHVNQGNGSPGFWVMFWLLFILLVIWHFIGWILLAIGIIAAALLAFWLYREYQAAAARLDAQIAEVGERADRQHDWFFKGDPRGVYGDDMWKGLSVEDFKNTHGEQGE